MTFDGACSGATIYKEHLVDETGRDVWLEITEDEGLRIDLWDGGNAAACVLPEASGVALWQALSWWVDHA